MKSIRLMAGAVFALAFASAYAQEQDVNQVVATVCSKCHGKDGNSLHSGYPNLAGQAKEYLLGQLKAFRDKSRKDQDAHAFMWGIAETLTDERAAKLAGYFSAQKPIQGKQGDPQLAAKGKEIFLYGIPNKQVPACALCHRSDAKGTTMIPRLAGQHAGYLAAQIKLFHFSYRPGLAVTMKAVVERLNDEETEQVASYLQGL